MKVKVRVKIQENKDEIIENQANIIVDLKMKLSALEGEYGMVSRHNKYLKAEIERLHRSEENNIGLQTSMKDLCSRYNKLISDYDDLKAKYDKLEADEEVHNSNKASIYYDKYSNSVLDYNVLKGDYDSIRTNYRNYLNTIIEACREKLEELNKNGGSKNG